MADAMANIVYSVSKKYNHKSGGNGIFEITYNNG